MSDDVAALADKIGIESADIMGYSLGGGVGLQLAIRHPERVKKLVVISMAFRAAGDYPEIRAAFDAMPAQAAAIAEHIKSSPLGAMYPDVDWEVIMRKSGEMNQKQHDWSEGVAAIKSPTLIMFADADSIQLDHMVAFYKLLGGGQRDGGMDGSGRSVNQFAVIPNRTHYNILTSPAVTILPKNFCLRIDGIPAAGISPRALDAELWRKQHVQRPDCESRAEHLNILGNCADLRDAATQQ